MLTKNSLFKVFLVSVCFMEAQVHSAAMAVSAVEIDSGVGRKFSRGELQMVVDNDRCLAGLDRDASLIKTYEILKAKIEKRLHQIEVLTTVEREKLISDTLGLTKMVAWLKLSDVHRDERKSDTFNYCIKLIKTIRSEVEDKRDSTLLSANLARILYFKLNNDRRDVSHSDFDTDQRRRKEIYNLYHKAIESGASKIVLLKAAELIMKHGYSPTGDKVQDLVIAEEMLTDFCNPKSVRSKGVERGGLFSPAQKSGGDVNRDRRHSLPFAGSSEVKDEASRLLSLLIVTKEEEHVAQGSPLVVPLAISGGSVAISGSGGGPIAAASPVPLSLAPFLPPLLLDAGMQVEDGGSVAVTTSVPVPVPVSVPVPVLNYGSDLLGATNNSLGLLSVDVGSGGQADLESGSIPINILEQGTLLPTLQGINVGGDLSDSPVMQGDDGGMSSSSPEHDDSDDVNFSPTKSHSKNKKHRIIIASDEDDTDEASVSAAGDSDAKPVNHKGKKAKKLSEREILKIARRLGSTYGKQLR